MPAPRQPIEIWEFPRPDLAPGAALLRTRRSEVCGTDVHLWHGRLSGVPYPIIPGHVSAGVLDSIHGPIAGLDGAELREGDRVVEEAEIEFEHLAGHSSREAGLFFRNDPARMELSVSVKSYQRP